MRVHEARVDPVYRLGPMLGPYKARYFAFSYHIYRRKTALCVHGSAPEALVSEPDVREAERAEHTPHRVGARRTGVAASCEDRRPVESSRDAHSHLT